MALFSTSASGQSLPFERLTPEEAAKRIEGCGVGPVTIRFDDLLQSHVLTVAGADAASDEQLKCIEQAASYHDVESPSAIQPKFNAMRAERWSAFALADAKEWLRKRGLLERVPTYTPGETNDVVFAREVETLCGPIARGAFESEYGPHVLDPDWIKGLGLPPKREGAEALSCLLTVTQVAGYEVGFIGNEAYTEDK